MDLSAMMRHFLLFLLIFLALVAYSCGNTDPTDVAALENLYTSLDSPSQLTGWSSSGGDPCSQSWKGVKCSGSAVTEIKLSGLGLTGSLGYQLSSLTSLKTLDLSNNHIQNSIPYQLPPNATSINLGSNSLNGVLPYSLSAMPALNFLNVSHNALSGQISDVFGKLTQLSTLDLSFNTFGQDLPSSFSSLSNLSSLYLQNNQLTGSVDSLSGLPLKTLNIENNHFTGWLPKTFPNNPLFKTAGNNFNQGPSPPSPQYRSPIPYQKPVDARNRNNNARNKTPSDVSSQPHTDEKTGSKGLSHGAVAGIIIGSILAACMASLVFVFSYRRPPNRASREKSLINDSASLSPLSSFSVKVPKESTDLKPKSSPPPMVLRPPPSDRHKSNAEKTFDRKLVTKLARSPIIAESYSIADLQVATNSFSQENLIGEGTLGRVYKAEFPDGKVLAVKKIDYTTLSLHTDEEFIDTVSSISGLRHQNITELSGYCIEHGQRLLVYEYFGNGTLHDILHYSEENGKRLSWNCRVRIALGMARALEYLHEVCSPSVVHRNFKSSNILLDGHLNPHLSDCGLAALTPSSGRQYSTHMLGSSFGYSAPEYAMSGVYTMKSDVYSFGVVMLELLTGRKPLDSSRPRLEQSLVRWATPQLHDIDALAKMVDQTMKGFYPAKSLSRFADIIALCVQPEPEFRPPMSEVVQALVRLMQRAGLNKRISGDEAGLSHRQYENEHSDYSV